MYSKLAGFAGELGGQCSNVQNVLEDVQNFLNNISARNC